MKNEAPNKPKNAETTGHEWDGIKEYNNPLPRWWVWVFLATIIFSVGYVLYYPALPGGKPTRSGWTSVGQLNEQVAAGEAQKSAFEQRIANTNLLDIAHDNDLHTYATAAGKAVFALNCAQCHGAGGAGAKGFPNLLDDEWIHGGSLSDIYFTVVHGVRSTDPDTRNTADVMPAWGKDGLLTPDQIEDVVNYLSVIAKGAPANESTQRGEKVFADNCVACHGDKGQGNRTMGAPPLNNDIWTFGGSHDDRVATVTNGRAAVMPTWKDKLTDNQIKEVAVYVHGLGGGEAEHASDTAVDPAMPSPTVVASPTTK